MNTRDDGGPAFPFTRTDFVDGKLGHDVLSQGMTLRQWYAGMALQGMLANGGHGNVTIGGVSLAYDEAAFVMADCMIAQGKK